MSDVTIKIAGAIHGGWTDVRIRRSLETISGSFDLSLTERWPGTSTPRAIKPGDACSVAVDGEVLITGYVDDAMPSYSADEHTVHVTGRDAAGDLVDCSAAEKPAEWHNQKIEQIAAALARPFGISVSSEVDTGAAFTKFTIEQGETVFEAIDRLCRMRAVLAISNGKGGIVITRAGTATSSSTLKRGENILSADARFSAAERFSRYIVKGQQQGADFLSPDQIAQPAATVEASGRYRPLVILAEDATDKANALRRAKWEANVRAARSQQLTITVQGWRQADGTLWHPNNRVRVVDDWLGISDSFLIAEVSFSKSDGGTTTDLRLMPPAAFDRLLEPEVKVEGGWL